MRLILNLFLFFLILVIFEDKSFSLSDYKIKKICEDEKKKNNLYKKFEREKI